jgi:hypothetical protein
LGFDGVGAHAEDGYTQLVEVFFCVAKLGRFYRSTGSVGFGVEEEEDLSAGEVLEGDGLAVVGWETEGGGFGADFQHSTFLRELIFKAYQESGRPHLPGRGKLRAASIN